MISLKTAPPISRSLARRLSASPALLAFALTVSLTVSLGPPLAAASAQTPETITILMLDGKTGKPVVPNNYMVRLNHLDAIHNEALQIDGDGVGKVTVPASAAFLSVQGTYRNSLEIYINCDAGMEKDTTKLHWYSIADIVSSGVAAPNECYKGKYASTAAVSAKPGEFIFYVREIGWRDTHSD